MKTKEYNNFDVLTPNQDKWYRINQRNIYKYFSVTTYFETPEEFYANIL